MIILTSHHPLSHLPPTPLGPSLLTNMSPSYSQDFVLFWYDPVSLWSTAYTNMVGGLLFTRSWASYLWLLIWLPLPQKPLIGNSSGTPAPWLSAIYDGMVMAASILYKSCEDAHSHCEFSPAAVHVQKTVPRICWLFCSFHPLFYHVLWAMERVIYRRPSNFYFVSYVFAAG